MAAYALVLLCGGAFYLFYPGYLSFYTLVLLALLPLLSLLLGLLARRRYTLTVSAEAAETVRGGQVTVRLFLRGPAGEPARLTYRLENLLCPALTAKGTVALRAGRPVTLTLPTGHCGWLRFTPLSCRMRDYLGGVALSIPLPPPTLVLVTPKGGVLPRGLDLESARSGLPLRPRPGGGPGEEYELRPYRPGDPVNAIHWKLTAKQPGDEPVLRETMEPVDERLAVSYDHFGAPDELDRVLDQLLGLARYLLDKEKAFTLCQADPVSGAVTRYDIDSPDAWNRCYRALAAKAAPPDGKGLSGALSALPGYTGAVKWVHLTADGGEEGSER